MKAVGVVTEIFENTAKVKCIRESACASCHGCEASGACHAELIFSNDSGEITVEATNKLCAKAGDRVELISASAPALFISLMLFVVPLFLTVGLYLIFDIFISSLLLKAVLLIASYFSFFVVMSQIMNRYVKNNFEIQVSKIIEGDE